MTVIVAVNKDDKIAIAADSLLSYGESGAYDTSNTEYSKLMDGRKTIIGCAGEINYTSVIPKVFKKKRYPALNSIDKVHAFFSELLVLMKKRYGFVNNQSSNTDTPFTQLSAEFIIVSAGKIFIVDDTMTIVEFNRFAAIGSGQPYAMGALYNLYDGRMNSSTIAKRAIETAINFDTSCGEPVEILTI